MKIKQVILIFWITIMLPGSGFGAEYHPFDSSTVSNILKDSTVNTQVLRPEANATGNILQKTKLDSTSIDSLNREKLRQSLLNHEKQRYAEYHHQNIDQILYDPYHVNSSILFLTDGTTPSEVLRSHPLVTTARYGLSSSLNRFMLYGAVAPVNKIYTGNILYEHSSSLAKGTDQNSVIDISDIFFTDMGSVRYLYNPGRIVSPEAHLFWENGVFDEKLLLVSMSRPISKHLSINAFTNYRYFKMGRFSQSADISSFYKTISDSNFLSDKGYNPLTEEFLAGLTLSWIGKNQSHLYLNATYGDFSHEISINKAADLREELQHALYQQYPFQLNTGSSWKLNNRVFLDFEAIFREEPFTEIKGDSIDNQIKPKRQDAKDREFDFGLRSGIELFAKDSLGLCYNFNRTAYTLFNRTDLQSYLHHPEIYYNYHFNFLGFQGLTRAAAGLTYFSINDTSEVIPVWNISASLKKNDQQYRTYFEQSNIPFIIDYDSLIFDQVLLDVYYKAGAEAHWKWDNIDLLLGYQLVYGTDSSTVQKSWPSGVAPYQQPVSSFVIAPSLGRWQGLALKSNINISDCKPILKIHSVLSFTAHPENTQEYIDAALTFDYWSERDIISFGGFDDWNTPIYNLGLEATAHIRSFRLFYKVDNILNRRFAYLPGYYSSGITFRWGFSWFLQR